MRGVPGIINFNSGELSPLLDARTDQDKYFAGCKKLENFLCSLQGPVIRRGGTRFVAPVKNDGNAWLAKFVFNRDQSYILEFGDNYIRFFVDRAQLFNGPNPYEIASPWSYADLTTIEGTFALHFAQSGDVLYITHASGQFRPKKLSRLGATNWTLTDFEFYNGPFKDIDPDNYITISASNRIGNITLTAGLPLFQPAHVGSLMLIESKDLFDFYAWESGKTIAAGLYYRYNGNVYESLNYSTTGTVPPTHIRDTARDGHQGVFWRYAHSGYGIVKITGFTSSTVVTATVIKELPTNVVTPNYTKRWAFQDVSNIEGWPVTIDFYKERLVMAKNRTVYMSSIGSFEDFSAKTAFDVLPTNAIRMPIALKQIDQIRWLSQNKDLLVGTDSFEFAIGPQTSQQVFGPGNVDVMPQTTFGSRVLQPLEVDNATIFVQSAGRRLREMLYSYEIERYRAEDLSVLSEHVPKSGIVDIALQKESDPVIWGVLSNGTLFGVTYNRPRGVVGWHRHVIGGFADANKTLPARVRSIETIAAPDGKRDDVWMIVERYINGGIKRYVEYIEDHELLETGQDNIFYVDSGLTYNGPPVTTLTGLDHLIGETVQITANGGTHADRVVNTSGQITLDFPASVISVGLKFVSTLIPMRLEFGSADGTAQSRIKSVSDIVIRFKDTVGGKMGIKENKLDPIPFRPPGLPVGQATPIYTGDKYVHAPSDWTRDGFIVIQQDQPLPMTVVGIYPRLVTND